MVPSTRSAAQLSGQLLHRTLFSLRETLWTFGQAQSLRCLPKVSRDTVRFFEMTWKCEPLMNHRGFRTRSQACLTRPFQGEVDRLLSGRTEF